jgi:hypothetical protein
LHIKGPVVFEETNPGDGSVATVYPMLFAASLDDCVFLRPEHPDAFSLYTHRRAVFAIALDPSFGELALL